MYQTICEDLITIYEYTVPEIISIQIGFLTEKMNKLESDYWRGIIDGDGSLGFTKNGIPYISLVTCSEILSNQYIIFLEQIIGYKKITTKNKRDSAYNIMVTNENAQKVIKRLYYKDCLSINRKYNMAIDIINWIRPTEKSIRIRLYRLKKILYN